MTALPEVSLLQDREIFQFLLCEFAGAICVSDYLPEDTKMAFPVNLLACSINPNSPECQEARQFFKELLEAAYLSRILPRLKVPLPRPDPAPFGGDPHPQPNLSAIAGNHNVLIGELLINALNGPNLTPPLKEIKKSGLQKEVANKVLEQLKASVKHLEKEVDNLK